MNRFEGGGEAVIEYLDSNIRVIRPGSYVRCAVTGQAIPLDQLKYWSVEYQEAYASPAAVLKRLGHALPVHLAIREEERLASLVADALARRRSEVD